MDGAPNWYLGGLGSIPVGDFVPSSVHGFFVAYCNIVRIPRAENIISQRVTVFFSLFLRYLFSF